MILYDSPVTTGSNGQTLNIQDTKQSVSFTVSKPGMVYLLLYAGVAGSCANNSVEYINFKLQEGNINKMSITQDGIHLNELNEGSEF